MDIFLLTINIIISNISNIVHGLCYENKLTGTLILSKMATRMIYVYLIIFTRNQRQMGHKQHLVCKTVSHRPIYIEVCE